MKTKITVTIESRDIAIIEEVMTDLEAKLGWDMPVSVVDGSASTYLNYEVDVVPSTQPDKPEPTMRVVDLESGTAVNMDVGQMHEFIKGVLGE